MGIKLKLHAEGTTINQTEGTVFARGLVENTTGHPVSVYPAQLNVRLENRDGRPVPIEVDGIERYEERTLMPGERMEFDMTLRASHIKLSDPFRLKAWWQDLGGEDSSPFHFRQVDPGP